MRECPLHLLLSYPLVFAGDRRAPAGPQPPPSETSDCLCVYLVAPVHRMYRGRPGDDDSEGPPP